MKKIYTISILLLFLMAASCSSNDDSSVTIPGTWKLTSLTFENEYDFNFDGTSSNDVLAETSCFLNDTWVFNSDNTGTITIHSNLSYLSSQNGHEMNCTVNTFPLTFTWTRNGDTIIVDPDDPSWNFVFTCTLIGNQLTYSRPETFLVRFLSGDPTLVDRETVVYTKQ